MPRQFVSAKPEVRTILGQPSWVIRNAQVELALTRLGGHMGPVTFKLGKRPIQPYHISPWQGEGLELGCPCLVPLRGDFFCLPFGGNQTPLNGERHPPHGETAGSPWTLAGMETTARTTTLAVSLKPQVRPGKITRQLSLVAGHNAVYCRTVIEGFAGPTTFAHHAMLAVPEQEKSLLVSTSPFDFGMTFPGVFSDPAKGEYQSFAAGKRFTDLARVPTRFKDAPSADCTAFPDRIGYADLLQLCEKPAAGQTPSWVAAVNKVDGWLWYALKDPALMPARVFWIENHGRHSVPWNGRNRCLGIEDGRMCFDLGVAASSQPNVISRRGIPTSTNLDGSPFEILYIQGAVRIPSGFGRVISVKFGKGTAAFVDEQGKRLPVPVSHEFIFGGSL
jgi:hypothetical protein